MCYATKRYTQGSFRFVKSCMLLICIIEKPRKGLGTMQRTTYRTHIVMYEGVALSHMPCEAAKRKTSSKPDQEYLVVVFEHL